MRLLAQSRLLLVALFVLGGHAEPDNLLDKMLRQHIEKSSNDKANIITPEQPISKPIEALEANKDDVLDFDSDELGVLESLVKLVPQASGAVSNAEKDHKLVRLKQSLFAMIDADANGHVTADELKGGCFNIIIAVLESVGGAQASPQALCRLATAVCVHTTSAPLHKVTKDQFIKAAFEFQDENGDGKVTSVELANTYFATAVYLTRDFHKFGKASPEQMCDAVAQSARSKEFDAQFQKLDSDKNGSLSRQEYEAHLSAYVT